MGIPSQNKLGIRFLFQTSLGKLQLAWYQHKKEVHSDDYWRFTVKLKPIHGLHNPGGFNADRWAHSRGIVAKGYVVARATATRLGRRRISINRFREMIQMTIHHAVKFKPMAGAINALTIGSKQWLSAEDWLVFQRTGTSHLMAISGLHIGLVVAIFYFMVNYFLRCFPLLLLYYPAQRMASLISLFVACCYGFLVGFSLPTQRAVIMVMVLVLMSLLSRSLSIWRRLSIAFLLVIAWQPFALYSPSFWLSFLAVFFLAYAALMKQGLQLVITVGLLPVSLYFFHQFSLVSIISNLIAIPWVTFLIVPLCLLAVVLFLLSSHAAAFVWCLAAKCLLPLWLLLHWFSHFTFSVWQHPVNDLWIVLSAMLGILLLFAPRGLPLRGLGVVLMLPLFVYFPARPAMNSVCLTVLDVGQGLSAVIQTAKHVLVYDAGPRFVTGFDAGRSVLMPYLQTRGIKSIDRLVISHGDNDHIGGSFWLVKHFPVGQIFSSILRSRWHRPFQHCYAGQQWEWDGVDFKVLWPLKGAAYKDNNSSCVLQVSTGQHSLLLTGDIEKPVEKALLSSRALSKVDVLIAPHHGSRSSSSLAFVQQLDPKRVIFPVGYLNRYHFPADSVIKRYRSLGADLLSTAEQGAIPICFAAQRAKRPPQSLGVFKY